MKKPPITSKLKEPVVRNTIIVFCVIAAGLLLYWGIIALAFNGNPFVTNRAKEIAMPIEKSLEQAGAVKVVENGAKGTEPTSDGSWYGVTYTTNLSPEQIIEIARKAASDNGYNLQLDNSNDKNTLSYTDKSKTSPFSDLENGKIVLWLEARNSSSGAAVENNNNTTVDLGVTLPNRKDR